MECKYAVYLSSLYRRRRQATLLLSELEAASSLLASFGSELEEALVLGIARFCVLVVLYPPQSRFWHFKPTT